MFGVCVVDAWFLPNTLKFRMLYSTLCFTVDFLLLVSRLLEGRRRKQQLHKKRQMLLYPDTLDQELLQLTLKISINLWLLPRTLKEKRAQQIVPGMINEVSDASHIWSMTVAKAFKVGWFFIFCFCFFFGGMGCVFPSRCISLSPLLLHPM